jgi:predicted transcriptional regulator
MSTETAAPSEKQVALEALSRMPESITLDQICEEMAILAAIRRGEAAADAGQVVTHGEVVRRSGRKPREGWDAAFREMARRGDDALIDDAPPTLSDKKRIEFAMCVAAEGYEDLEAWKVYRAAPDPKAAEVGCLRVVDESGENYLYPADRFVAVDFPKEVRERLLAESR